MGEWINVKDPPYSAVGDGIANDLTKVQSAVTAADGKTVYFPKGTYKLGDGSTPSSLTISGNRTVEFAPGATLKPQTNMTVTIDCSITAPRAPIFTLNGTGVVKLGQNGPRTIFPEWWGAVVGGTVDCSPAIQAAINAITDDTTGARGGEVIFSAGEYRIGSTITLPRGYYRPKLTLRGAGVFSTALHSPSRCRTGRTDLPVGRDRHRQMGQLPGNSGHADFPQHTGRGNPTQYHWR